jgi:hypothetical protein
LLWEFIVKIVHKVLVGDGFSGRRGLLNGGLFFVIDSMAWLFIELELGITLLQAKRDS